MTSNLFLILHKVRGAPAFDVAEAVLIDGEEAWLIPTSGHRAYPAKAWALEELALTNDIGQTNSKPTDSLNLPETLRDHYQSLVLPKDAKRTTASEMLRALGLGPKPIKRRPI